MAPDAASRKLSPFTSTTMRSLIFLLAFASFSFHTLTNSLDRMTQADCRSGITRACGGR